MTIASFFAMLAAFITRMFLWTGMFGGFGRGMGHAFFLLPVEGEPTLLTDPRKHRAELVVVEDIRAAAGICGERSFRS